MTDYLSSYGVRYNRDQSEKKFPGPFGGLLTGSANLIKEGFSATGDFANYVEVECTGLTQGNFQQKLGQFKQQILTKIQKHNGITNISMDCLLKNDKYEKNGNSKYGKPVIVSVVKYNSIKGNWSSGHETMRTFSKDQQIHKSGAGAELLTQFVSFDNILEETFTWDKLVQFLDEDDSIRMVISKKGLDDIKNGKITICDDKVSGASASAGRRRSSRKYKKSNRNVKSSKKRSYTTKYSRTRRYRK